MPDQFIDGLDKSTFSADRAPLSRLRSSRFKLATLAAGVGLLALACGSAAGPTEISAQPTQVQDQTNKQDAIPTPTIEVTPLQKAESVQQSLEQFLYKKTYSPDDYRKYAAYIRQNTWTVLITRATAKLVYAAEGGILPTNFPDTSDLSGYVDESWKWGEDQQISSNIFIKQENKGTGVKNYWLVTGTTPQGDVKVGRVYEDRGSLFTVNLRGYVLGDKGYLHVPEVIKNPLAEAVVRFRDGD